MSKRSKHARRGEKPAALVKSALPVAKARDDRWTAAIVPILIVLVALLAYANSFSTAFVLDDMGNVENSYSIRSFMPTRTSLFGPPWRTFTGRPIVFWSFALNYRLNGLDVEGYHAFNVAVHILAALALWGVLRRTFRLSALQSEFAGVADTLATAITILWVVHPLTTAAVTYISQRAESLMAVTYFLTIYCFLRGIESGRSGRWYVVAVICCLLGVGCKEPIVTAPLFVLLYDRTLVAGSFAAALKQRRWLYAGLFGTWIPMGIVHAFHPHGTDAAFGYAEFTVWDNLRTQSRAIVQYLRLCFWPDQLILYYGRANKDISVPGNFWQYAPSGCIVLLLLGLSVWAVWKKLPMGLAGAWFFLILGPSSSVIVMPTEVIAEYRMYRSTWSASIS
jgi:hypothetical protein